MISVIIPLYNKEKTICKTINSILEQNISDLEIVVVNDGSTDKSLQVLEKIQSPQIRVINKTNGGVSRARNTGIKVAKGDWLLFLDADDVLMPNSLAKVYALKDIYSDVVLLSGNFITLTGPNQVKASTLNEQMVIKDPFEMIWENKWNLRLGSFLVNRNHALSFIDDMSKGEDVVYCWDILKGGDVAYIPVDLMTYVRDASTLSKKILPLEKCMSWALDFHFQNLYYRLLSFDILIKGFLYYLLHKPSYSIRLFFKYTSVFCTFSFRYLYEKIKNR